MITELNYLVEEYLNEIGLWRVVAEIPVKTQKTGRWFYTQTIIPQQSIIQARHEANSVLSQVTRKKRVRAQEFCSNGAINYYYVYSDGRWSEMNPDLPVGELIDY